MFWWYIFTQSTTEQEKKEDWNGGWKSVFWVKCKWPAAHIAIYFLGRKKKKVLLSDDKHFPWLLKNDINVARVGGGGVTLW